MWGGIVATAAGVDAAGSSGTYLTQFAAGEFGKSVEFQDSDSTDDLGLFWTKKP